MALDKIEQHREYCRSHYQRNKERYLERNRRYKAQVAQIMQDRKAHPCADCKRTFPPYVMEFHHLDPTSKSGNVANLAFRGSMKRMLAEIEKCVVLCSNCHRIRTHG